MAWQLPGGVEVVAQQGWAGGRFEVLGGSCPLQPPGRQLLFMGRLLGGGGELPNALVLSTVLDGTVTLP